jgi:hypothetical protein
VRELSHYDMQQSTEADVSDQCVNSNNIYIDMKNNDKLIAFQQCQTVSKIPTEVQELVVSVVEERSK